VVILPLIILFDIFITKVKVTKIKTVLSYVPFAVLTILYPIVRVAATSLLMAEIMLIISLILFPILSVILSATSV